MVVFTFIITHRERQCAYMHNNCFYSNSEIRICQSELPVSKKKNRGQRSFYKTNSEEGDREFPSQILIRQKQRGALTAETAGDPDSSDALDPTSCSRNSSCFLLAIWNCEGYCCLDSGYEYSRGNSVFVLSVGIRNCVREKSAGRDWCGDGGP